MSKLLKIGFAGNTNNYPFTLALAFDKLGHDVKFLVDSTEKLHRPEFKYSEPQSGNIKILNLNPYPEEPNERPSEEKMKQFVNFFSDSDVLILNGRFISLHKELNKPFIPLVTGSDLDYLASDSLITEFKRNRYSNFSSSTIQVIEFLSSISKREYPKDKILYSKNKSLKILGEAQLLRYVKHQKEKQQSGFKNAKALVYFPKGLIKSGEKILNSIGAGEKKRVFNLMTDTDEIKQKPFPENTKVVRIFNVARFNWNRDKAPASYTELDFKGNDIMIKGLHLFCKAFPDIKLEIVFVRKGANLKETYDLINQLEMTDKITWIDELSQFEVLQEFEKADIIFDQLSTSLVGMGGLDALAIGRPLIANWRPEYFEQFVGKWPVCQATNENEVFEWLKTLVKNPSKREEIGQQSRDFVVKNLSSKAFAERITNAIHENDILSCVE